MTDSQMITQIYYIAWTLAGIVGLSTLVSCVLIYFIFFNNSSPKMKEYSEEEIQQNIERITKNYREGK